MARKLEIDIKETAQELKQLLLKQKRVRIKERVQVLSWLKTQRIETALAASELIGRTYSSVNRWLKTYRQSGLKELLKLKHGGGKALSLSPDILEALNNRLKQPQGFESYEAIQIWLERTYEIEVGYSTLYGIVHNRLNASPKVVRPYSAKRDESQAIDFEKKRHYDSVG